MTTVGPRKSGTRTTMTTTLRRSGVSIGVPTVRHTVGVACSVIVPELTPPSGHLIVRCPTPAETHPTNSGHSRSATEHGANGNVIPATTIVIFPSGESRTYDNVRSDHHRRRDNLGNIGAIEGARSPVGLGRLHNRRLGSRMADDNRWHNDHGPVTTRENPDIRVRPEFEPDLLATILGTDGTPNPKKTHQNGHQKQRGRRNRNAFFHNIKVLRHAHNRRLSSTHTYLRRIHPSWFMSSISHRIVLVNTTKIKLFLYSLL